MNGRGGVFLEKGAGPRSWRGKKSVFCYESAPEDGGRGLCVQRAATSFFTREGVSGPVF